MKPPETPSLQAELPHGIAHVSFAGGGAFLPARTPYDLQMLVEHVLRLVRASGEVQVLVDDRRWIVHLRSGASTAWCSCCGYSLGSVFYSNGDAKDVCCAECALGENEVKAIRRAPRVLINDAA